MLASEGVGLLSEGALCALVEDDELYSSRPLKPIRALMHGFVRKIQGERYGGVGEEEYKRKKENRCVRGEANTAR